MLYTLLTISALQALGGINVKMTISAIDAIDRSNTVLAIVGKDINLVLPEKFKGANGLLGRR